MKLNTTDFLRKCQHPMLIASGTLPIGVLLLLHTAPQALPLLPALAAAYVLLAWGCILVPGKRRMPACVVCAALLTALCLTLLPVASAPALALLPAALILLLMLSLPIGGWDRARELSPAWTMIGACSHVLLQLLAGGARKMGSAQYDPADAMLLFAFLLFAAMVMLAFNRGSLDSAAQSRRTIPVRMRRVNRVLTMLLLIVAVLIAAIPSISTLLGRLWDLLMHGIAALAALIASLFPRFEQTTAGGPAAPMEDLGFGETAEPGMLLILLERVLAVVAVIALGILVLYAGRKLLGKLRILLRWLWQRLMHYGSAASEDYEDEITDTREDAERGRTGWLNRLRIRFPAADESRMTPTQRVRYRYLRLRMKHAEWHSSATARQTLPPEAAQVYERARYGGQTLTNADADSFREATRRV